MTTTKNKKYQVIYADPPWHYNNSLDNASNQNSKINADKVYPTMSSKDIAHLPVKGITEDDAICFMWTTDTHVPQAIEIMKAWGFTYKTIAFVWEKLTKNGKSAMVMGPWIHKNCEICLMGTKGKMMQHLRDNKVQQLVKAQRTKHSKKPQEVADLITRMFPAGEKIELFARDAKPGWDVWGNEIQNDIQMDLGGKP
jgi:site-specific DNA-methyltransferase (adenine-specific)